MDSEKASGNLRDSFTTVLQELLDLLALSALLARVLS